MTAAFQRHGLRDVRLGLHPPCKWGWDPDRGLWPCHPAAWLLSVVPAAGGENRALWLRGCRRPACNQGLGAGAFVLCWQPVWGDRPVSGVWVKVPQSGREGASLCPRTEAAL